MTNLKLIVVLIFGYIVLFGCDSRISNDVIEGEFEEFLNIDIPSDFVVVKREISLSGDYYQISFGSDEFEKIKYRVKFESWDKENRVGDPAVIVYKKMYKNDRGFVEIYIVPDERSLFFYRNID